MSSNTTTEAGLKYTGDDLGGIVIARINDELLIAAEHDLEMPDRFSWNQAAKKLEEPWRFPALTELGFLRENAEQLGLVKTWYWGEALDATYAWTQTVSGAAAGYQSNGNKTFANSTIGVRPVRRVSALTLPLGEVEQSETEAVDDGEAV